MVDVNQTRQTQRPKATKAVCDATSCRLVQSEESFFFVFWTLKMESAGSAETWTTI